jgi:hypothetical protein
VTRKDEKSRKKKENDTYKKKKTNETKKVLIGNMFVTI